MVAAEIVRPSGTVTFLFTDVEASTRQWEDHSASMRVALERHDQILRSLIGEHGGYVFSTSGDAFAAAFSRAGDAADAACAVQDMLGLEEWPAPIEIRVRIGLHLGEAQERDGDYFGVAVNRAARVMAVAHGGQVLASDTVAALLDSERLTDLGVHHLKDVSEPMTLLQVGPGQFPPLRTVDGLGRGLRGFATTLIARDDEARIIEEHLGRARVVTLTGPGGVGKTRLAVETALGSLGRWPDGARLVELAPAADAASVHEAIAAAVGARQLSGRSLLESTVDHLQDRRMLLVVDNCEHLVDEAAETIEYLTLNCDGLSVLATSRERLAIGGEQVFEVQPLALELDGEPLSAAAALFVARANERGAQLGDDSETMSLVRTICEGLDGLPLALELAAGRARTLGLAQVAEGLSSQLGLLAEKRSRRPDRQRSVRGAIDWSFELLDADEQALLCRLSVLTGWWQANELAAVAGPDPETMELLESLVDKSMVQADVARGAARYRMLESIRQFGHAELDSSGLRDEVRDQHLGFYAARAQRIGEVVRTPDEGKAVAVAERSSDNFRVAHQWALERADPAAASGLVAGLHDWAVWRDRYELGLWAEATLGLPRADQEPLAPVVCATAGWRHNKLGDFDTAIAFAERGLALEQNPGAVECGWLHDVLAHTAFWKQEMAEGLRHSQAEIDRARLSRDPYRLGYVLGDNGAHYSQQAAPDEAPAMVMQCEEALEIARQSGAPSVVSNALHTLGATLRLTDSTRARTVLGEGLDLARTVDAQFVISVCCMQLASVAATEAPTDALPLLRESLDHLVERDMNLFRFGTSAAISPFAALLSDTHAPQIGYLLGALQILPGPKDPTVEAHNSTIEQELEARYGEAVTSAIEEGRRATMRQLVAAATQLLTEAETRSQRR